jgi:hypothetical protein
VVVQAILPGAQASSSTLVLVGTDGIWSLGQLTPNQQVAIPVRIFASPSAAGTLISLTVTSSYIDLGYKPKQQINYLGIIARGNVNLVVLGTSTFPTNVTEGTPFSLTVSFINLGTTTAQSVIFTPNGTGGIQPSSTDKIFVGDLAVNIPSSFTIPYKISNVTTGSYNVNLNYTYKDSLGGIYANTLEVPFKLVLSPISTTQNQSNNFGGLSQNLLLAAMAVVIVGAVVLYFRHRKSRSS